MNQSKEIIWHAISTEEIFKNLESGEQGLTPLEAKNRLERYGYNKLPETKPDSVLIIFLRQFQSPLVYILLVASLAVFLLGEVTDGVVIMTVLVFNAFIGAFQEGKARNTILALKQFVDTKAVVRRSEEEIIIPDSEVALGDILILQEGEKVSADARLISTHNLKIDESALTGESVPVHKTEQAIHNPDLPTQERTNIVFKGTHIVSGNATAIAVATGVHTIIGQIAREVATIDTDVPIKVNIKNLSRLIIIAAVIITVGLFALGIFYGNSAREMFATAVSLAVSVTPAGLPIALTIILAVGVWRMSKRNALVKRLQAVEALGQAKIIAVDKTGTITRNEMMVQTVFTDGKIFEVGGIGYEPKGEIRLEGEIVDPPNHPELLLAGKMAAFSANARVMFMPEKKDWKISGDPTEAAMLIFAEKMGFKKDDLEREMPLVSEIPFDYTLKYHATLHREKKNGAILGVVGAPEMVLALSSKILAAGKEKKLSNKEIEGLEKIVLNMSRRGLRVIAFAKSRAIEKDLEKEDIKNLTFLGFFGLRDALRPEVKSATRGAEEAGVKVVMITGDHRETAQAIAKEADIYHPGDVVMTGREIDELTDNNLKEKLASVSVFARVTPEHKLRIINAYKERGETIAMTGDGVNDAPSLVAADLGVAMGITGTEVAKEVSDIILLDDNFGSIVSAIEEGRSIYKTIRKVIVYLISTSIGEVLVITGALFLGLPLPLLAAQIIWLNFVTDGFFVPAIAMEPREDGLLKKGFEKPNKYLIDRSSAIRMFLMALPMMIFTLLVFNSAYEENIAKAWTLSLTLLAIFQWFNAWNCRSDTKSVFKMNPLKNKYLIGGTLVAFLCQLLAVYHPFFQTFLRTVPLSFSDWIVLTILATSILVVDEIRKIFVRRSKSSEKKMTKPTLIRI